jgi:hypothetical protein
MRLDQTIHCQETVGRKGVATSTIAADWLENSSVLIDGGAGWSKSLIQRRNSRWGLPTPRIQAASSAITRGHLALEASSQPVTSPEALGLCMPHKAKHGPLSILQRQRHKPESHPCLPHGNSRRPLSINSLGTRAAGGKGPGFTCTCPTDTGKVPSAPGMRLAVPQALAPPELVQHDLGMFSHILHL